MDELKAIKLIRWILMKLGKNFDLGSARYYWEEYKATHKDWK